MDLTQINRFGSIRTLLPPDVLLLRGVRGEEGLSRPVLYVAELSSTNHAVDFNAVVGRQAVIRMSTGNGTERFLHGWVSRFVQVPGDRVGARYRAELVPWLWLLTRTSDCRIFHRPPEGLTVIEIVEEVFRRFGFTDYRLKLTRSYRKVEYCVQYRETAFNFVSRLLETEGVAYYFEHEADRHVLVLADSPSAHVARPECEEIGWHPLERAGSERERIRHWEAERQLRPASYLHTEYNFLRPRTDLSAGARFVDGVPGHEWEVFNYPGEYDQLGEGEMYARIRAEELGAGQDVYSGESDVVGMAAGHTFRLKEHPRADQNREYLLTQVGIDFDQSAYLTGEDEGGVMFRNRFSAIPAQRPYRPPRVTPKPVIHGEQTAMVVGPPGKEIHVDDHARVKVHFFWDRHQRMDDTASCWLRVSQPWAGKGYGGLNIPRVGCEVIVGFLEGDPDRPIITGRVYNAATMPMASNAGRDGKPGNAKPSGIAQAAMMTTLRSQSTPGGGGGNEITLNDTAGAEGLYFKAHRDEVHQVGNDREDTVGNDSTCKVGNNLAVEVGSNADEKVKVAKVVDVGTTLLIKAGTSITLQCGASTLHMNQAGFITLSGTVIATAAGIHASVSAPIVSITGALATSVSGALIWSGSILSRWDSAAGFTIKAGADVNISGANIHFQA